MLLEDLHERELQRQRDSENLAMLVDRHDYWLTFDYVNETTDPDDPDVKKARAERKRLRIKPPPVPQLRAVALRRSDVAEQVESVYARLRTVAEEPAQRESSRHAGPKSQTQLVDEVWG